MYIRSNITMQELVFKKPVNLTLCCMKFKGDYATFFNEFGTIFSEILSTSIGVFFYI